LAGRRFPQPGQDELELRGPKLSCGKANQAIVPSVGVFTSPSNNFSAADMFVGCTGGKALYFPVLVMNSKPTRHKTGAKAHPGDKIVLKASVNATRTVLTTLDKTTKIKRTLTGPGSTTLAYPSVGDDGHSTKSTGLWGVPKFRTLKFSQTVLNGQPFASSPDLVQWDRYRGTTLQIKTSLFGSDQETFKTVFKHS
jgi:hypothetical protein